jgi:thiol-disulfide isomerase/thioredoxin
MKLETLKRYGKRALIVTAIAGIVAPAVIRAQEAPAPEAPPAQAPATQPAGISGQARTQLQEMADAYGRAKTLQLNGTITLDFDLNGDKLNQSGNFTSSYEAPNRFRHEMQDDVLLVTTPDNAYAFLKARNLYLPVQMPEKPVPMDELPQPIPQVLSQQNPSLLFALSSSLVDDMTENLQSAERIEDVKIGDVAHPVIRMVSTAFDSTLVIDPKTSLPRQVIIDRRRGLTQEGHTVNKAQIVYDYTTVSVDAAIPEGTFAWTPPEGAQEVIPPDAEVRKMIGQDAPDFTLAVHGSDEKVTLSELKGNVVLLDFWATWCGPCIVGMPKIDALYKEFQPKGLKAYAVNLEEDKATIDGFLERNKISLPVLMGADNELLSKYKSQAIPLTVVIDKGGKIREVALGVAPDTETKLRNAIKAELEK